MAGRVQLAEERKSLGGGISVTEGSDVPLPNYRKRVDDCLNILINRDHCSHF